MGGTQAQAPPWLQLAFLPHALRPSQDLEHSRQAEPGRLTWRRSLRRGQPSYGALEEAEHCVTSEDHCCLPARCPQGNEPAWSEAWCQLTGVLHGGRVGWGGGVAELPGVRREKPVTRRTLAHRVLRLQRPRLPHSPAASLHFREGPAPGLEEVQVPVPGALTAPVCVPRNPARGCPRTTPQVQARLRARCGAQSGAAQPGAVGHG